MHPPGTSLTQFGVDDDEFWRVNSKIDKLALDVGAKGGIDAHSNVPDGPLPPYLALLGFLQLQI